MTGFGSAYEDTRRRSVDQADVEGSNPFGPTTQHCLSGQDSCLFSAFELAKCGKFLRIEFLRSTSGKAFFSNEIASSLYGKRVKLATLWPMLEGMSTGV